MEAGGEGVLAVVGTGQFRLEGAKKRVAAADSDGEDSIGEEEGMLLE